MAIELIPAMTISSSGLRAERIRMDLAANNLANVHSTRNEDGDLYARRQAVFSAVLSDTLAHGHELGGVKVDQVVEDPRPPKQQYAPFHPDADESGMINLPNISAIEEMLDMITASRAYEANLKALKQSREIANQTIQMGKPA